LESDFDQMIVNNRVFCLEDDVKSCAFPGEITVLRSLSRRSYHGHCRLLLERLGTTIHRHVHDAFCDDGYGRELLSSDLFVNNWSNERLPEFMVQHERAGPSIPNTMHGNLHRDKDMHYITTAPTFCQNGPQDLATGRHRKSLRGSYHLGRFLRLLDLKGVNINMLNGECVLTPVRSN